MLKFLERLLQTGNRTRVYCLFSRHYLDHINIANVKQTNIKQLLLQIKVNCNTYTKEKSQAIHIAQ